MKFHFIFWVCLAIFSLGPAVEAGEIYEWIDKDGVRHFTDGPPPPGAQLVEGLTETSSDPPPQAGAPVDGNTGAAEADESVPNEGQGADAVQEGEQGSAGREDYWRRRGWGNGPTAPEDAGRIEDGERGPTDSENAGALEDAEGNPPPPDDGAAVEDGERGPGGDDQWGSRGW